MLLLLSLLQSVGTINFTVQFMPFEEPKFDDDIELKPVKTGEHRLSLGPLEDVGWS